MKNKEKSPYTGYGYNKITAPNNSKNDAPRASKITKKSDLRGRDKK